MNCSAPSLAAFIVGCVVGAAVVIAAIIAVLKVYGRLVWRGVAAVSALPAVIRSAGDLVRSGQGGDSPEWRRFKEAVTKYDAEKNDPKMQVLLDD